VFPTPGNKCALRCALSFVWVQAVRAQLTMAPVWSPDEDDHWLPAAWLEHWAAGEVCKRGRRG